MALDRFPLETAAELAGNYNRRFYLEMYEEQTHLRDEADYDAVNCPDEEEETDERVRARMCPTRFDVMMDPAHRTLGEMSAALRAHEAACSRCGSTRKTVVSDRLALGTPGSACCDEVA